MSIRTLSARLARIAAQRDNRAYQAAWDDACQLHGWPRVDVGTARRIEDLTRLVKTSSGNYAV